MDDKKLKSLTWKYFWEQKKKEIFKFTFIILCISLVILLFWGFAYLIDNYVVVQWIVAIIMGGLFVSLISYLIYEWIMDNWTRAKKRASEKLKTKVKRR